MTVERGTVPTCSGVRERCCANADSALCDYPPRVDDTEAQDARGGDRVRRLIPYAVAATVVIAVMEALGEHADLFGLSVGNALLGIAFVALIVVTLLYVARETDRI